MYAGRRFLEKELCIPIFLFAWIILTVSVSLGQLREVCMSHELGLAQLGHFWFLHLDLTSVSLAENVAGLGAQGHFLYKISDQM